MENFYISIMGKCDKNPSHLETIQNIFLEISKKYKLNYQQGLMKDIDTNEITTAFAGTFFLKCNDYNNAEIINNKILSELEANSVFIHSSRFGQIN